MRLHNRFLTLALAAAALAAAEPAYAQIIRGQVVDASTGAPIQGAFVVLLDSAGVHWGETLSGDGGAFVVRAPRPGRYVLRAERIGYADRLSDTLRLAQGQVLTYRFAIGVKPVNLEGLKVTTGKGRCRMPRDVGAETSMLWGQIRQALSIAVWGEEERGVAYQIETWSRTRDVRSLAILADTVRIRSGYGRRLFTSKSARSLGSKGYIRREADGSYTFYGLDARTLLSDGFLDSHCFRVEAAGQDQKGLIGLAFKPVHRNGPPDITGTLWVDRATAQLRYLRFTYDEIPSLQQSSSTLPLKSFGGRVDFRRLDNGSWVVRRWWLRMPQPEVGPSSPWQPRRFHIHEQGGEIRFIGAAGGSGSKGHSDLSGTVYDSTRSMPLAGANVFLTDVNRATVTDFLGRFHFHDLPAGTHRVAFTAPRADSLGLSVTPRTVGVDPDHYTSVSLGIPREAACPASTKTGGVLGFVVDSDTGEPVPRVEVRVTWFRAGISSTSKRVAHVDTTDAHGRYLLCGVPLATDERAGDVELAAVGGAALKLHLGTPGLVWRELLVGHDGG